MCLLRVDEYCDFNAGSWISGLCLPLSEIKNCSSFGIRREEKDKMCPKVVWIEKFICMHHELNIGNSF